MILARAATGEEKASAYEQMMHFKGCQEVHLIDHLGYRYLSKWYYPAIRELVLLESFRENPSLIAKKLSGLITSTQAKEALEALLEMKLVVRDEKNRLIPTEKNVSTNPEIMEFSVKHYHKNMLDLAGMAMQNTSPEFRDISSITIPVNVESFQEAKRRIQEFRREMNVFLSKTEKPTAVYQLNLQFFNLTQIPWKKDKS